MDQKIIIEKWPLAPEVTVDVVDSPQSRNDIIRSMQMVIPACVKSSCCEWNGNYKSDLVLSMSESNSKSCAVSMKTDVSFLFILAKGCAVQKKHWNT